MTQAQQQAANPAISCFVSANAGTGKTRVLTYRVLRLLLAGVAPQHILCLTFTNAAAAEMQERVMGALKEWYELEDDELQYALKEVQGAPTSVESCELAKGLYHQILLGESQLNIQTIHGFCLRVLQHFPVEAGLAPNVQLMDDRLQLQLMNRAREVMLSSGTEAAPRLNAALDVVAEKFSPYSVEKLLKELIASRDGLLQLWDRYGDGDAHYKALLAHYGIEVEDAAPEKWVQYFMTAMQPELMLAAASALREGLASDEAHADALEAVARKVKAGAEDAAELIAEYCNIFLKKDGGPKAKLMTATPKKNFPKVHEWLVEEQQRCMAHCEQMNICNAIGLGDAVYHLGGAMVATYQSLKADAGLIDFHDVIAKVLDLMSRSEMAEWVLYQLDQKVEHLLVDEAQDTSPQQWQVVHALVDDFFAGEGAGESQEKTLFVVGDYKQSIYRFQGANPELFRAYGEYFKQRAAEAEKRFEMISLDRSFRTTAQVLNFVDHLFAVTPAHEGAVLEDAMQHPAHREAQGVVELWPLVETEKAEELPPWYVAPDYVAEEKGVQQLAKQVAEELANWFDKGRVLSSENRPVRAGDVMILVRNRGALYEALHHALVQAGVAVSGQDRLALLSHLFTQDMLAFARFLTNPNDDYSLACVLKSPLYALSEEALFRLCAGREEQSLYAMLQQSSDAAHGEIVVEIEALLAQVDHSSPATLFRQLLIQRGGREHYIGTMGEEITALLAVFFDQLSQYEAQEIPSMRGFSHWLEGLHLEVKQEMDEAGDAVRIMTVHGSKGLEAPIVLLPDTCSTPNLRNETLMVHESELAQGDVLECWTSQKAAPSLLAEQRERLKALEQEEYHRQLYVAMTRARDELYMMGAPASNRKAGADCWYSYMRRAMESVDGVVEDENGRMRIGEAARYDANAQEQTAADLTDIPEHLMRPARKENSLWKRPSSHDDAEEYVRRERGEQERDDPNSLIGCDDILANELGTYVHLLLEHVPNIAPKERALFGEALLCQQAEELSEVQRNALVNHVLYLLDAPSLQWLWAADARAELSVISREGEARYSGQVDRLVMRDGALWVVDFKSDRNPPLCAEEVPHGYQAQLRHYHQMLAPLYPDVPIRCGVLYTVSAQLIEIPEVAATSNKEAS